MADDQAQTRTPDLLGRMDKGSPAAGLRAIIGSLFDGAAVSTSALEDADATIEAIQALFEGVQARLASGTVSTDPIRLAAAARGLLGTLVRDASR